MTVSELADEECRGEASVASVKGGEFYAQRCPNPFI